MARTTTGVPLDAAAVRAAMERDKFIGICRIVREDESIGSLNITPTQRQVLDACTNHRWVMIKKYRQAKITTLMILDLLGQCMYTPGVQGVLIAEKYDTAETAWGRARYAYDYLPDAIRIPTRSGRDPAKREMEFVHGGRIKTITAATGTPAIGNSPDRVVVTEYDEFSDQDNFNAHFFPSVAKRQNARVVMESTPGRQGTTSHTMWMKALEGSSQFHPVFLKWWLDDSCTAIDPTFVPDQSELRIMEELEGITYAHLAFRRQRLDTEFVGEDSKFRHKYPYGPYDGWTTESGNVLPSDSLLHMLTDATTTIDNNEHYYEEREEGCPYVLTCDPAGYGSDGDPSAITLWNAWDHSEVMSWSGREDPGRLAARILRIQQAWDCEVVVESNAPACVQALVGMRCPKLYHTGPSHPGWYMTSVGKSAAIVVLVEMLRAGEMKLHTKATIHQLLQWDGESRKRGKGEHGRHHFDRAITVMIAAAVFRKRGYGLRPASSTRNVVMKPGQTASISVETLDKLFKPRRNKTLGIHP
jgi:hypothetical protein